MCTAVSFRTKDHYFGRNLDLEYCYDEQVCVTPRNMPLCFRLAGELKRHFAYIGMATVMDGIPLYYDATNERGLSIAGLNFPGNAFYGKPQSGMDNVASFELIPYLLGQYATVAEVRQHLPRLNIIDISFSETLPTSPLHWMVSDREESIVLEAMKDGLHVYDNPTGVLTNNPPFDFQLFALNNYRALGPAATENRFSPRLSLTEYCRGLGAYGLPGDLSSTSRFVRASYVALNSRCAEDEMSSVSQFFHILTSVEQQRGCVLVQPGEYEVTFYSSCVNTDRGVYYYVTYDNRQISAVDMHREDLEGAFPICYPLRKAQSIYYHQEHKGDI